MRRILVTGAATWTGGELIAKLEQRTDLELVAVDEIPAPGKMRTEIQIFELDNPAFAHFVIDVKPDTVIHFQTMDRSALLGGRRAHDEAVVGAQALFGAIRRCRTIKSVVVKSDLCVYGTGPRSPSVAFETGTHEGTRGRYARDLEQVERFTADAATFRDDAIFTVLRFAPIFGAGAGNPLSRYLRLPVVPTRLGYDPRIQLLSGHDAVGVSEHAIDNPMAGTFNVAAAGQLYLSRILRLGKRVAQPLPRRAYDIAIKGLSRADLHLPSHVRDVVHYGMVADTTRMTTLLGFTPTMSIRETVLDGYRRVTAGPRVS